MPERLGSVSQNAFSDYPKSLLEVFVPPGRIFDFYQIFNGFIIAFDNTEKIQVPLDNVSHYNFLTLVIAIGGFLPRFSMLVYTSPNQGQTEMDSNEFFLCLFYYKSFFPLPSDIPNGKLGYI